MIKKNLLYMEAVYKHKIKVGGNKTMEGHFGPPVLHESKSFEELRITLCTLVIH